MQPEKSEGNFQEEDDIDQVVEELYKLELLVSGPRHMDNRPQQEIMGVQSLEEPSYPNAHPGKQQEHSQCPEISANKHEGLTEVWRTGPVANRPPVLNKIMKKMGWGPYSGVGKKHIPIEEWWARSIDPDDESYFWVPDASWEGWQTNDAADIDEDTPNAPAEFEADHANKSDSVNARTTGRREESSLHRPSALKRERIQLECNQPFTISSTTDEFLPLQHMINTGNAKVQTHLMSCRSPVRLPHSSA